MIYSCTDIVEYASIGATLEAEIKDVDVRKSQKDE